MFLFIVAVILYPYFGMTDAFINQEKVKYDNKKMKINLKRNGEM